jgi:fructokinase
MPDIIALGEILIDFVSLRKGFPLWRAPGFLKAAGGAPANVAAGLGKLGVKVGFIGKVGSDPFGVFLKNALQECNVDVSHIVISNQYRTTLAFVSLTEEGERDFVFFRHPGADMMLSPEEMDEEYIKRAKILHFGSISLINEPYRSATLRALRIARENGLLVSYDPNLRLSLWENEEKAKEGIALGLGFSDIVKLSEEELHFLTGKGIEEGCAEILETGKKLVVITLGEKGCYYYTREGRGYVEGFKIKVVDTTGAGDGFVAGMLYKILEFGEDFPKSGDEIFRFANAVGALTCEKRGAIRGLPTLRQVRRFLTKR